MKKTSKMILLLLLCVVIAVIPLLMIQNSEFGGADGAAEELITEINPEYEPWFESLIELPGGETESLLFALQAALGAGVIGAGFGYFVGRKKGA
ncbi:energy-coupling factor ABC transporter substrate-binding protein [Facklamia sp. DSM 111018]|uniref:Cobalt transport protein CbiN n=1 Tax=Facklamia lactis TaxID=2749967 RepID=A0ABS0LR27_9LACT|nr:energy-coupling factor ABC transporter substrate-binding protein [Facklamia lactis]MBG9979514.1 energy-coupling factor ABC transporter substrate-binding protein [Facklamia lactis]MBG9985816.1 energy-coupling factor ABC transporter substrate-binding protein [Facklamia lactis]